MADPEVADVDAEVEADVEAEVEGLAGRLDVVPRDQKVVGRVVVAQKWFVAQKSSTLCTTHVDVSPFGNAMSGITTSVYIHSDNYILSPRDPDYT